MIDVTPPTTKDDLLRELSRVHGESVRYWASFDTASFVSPLGEAWSPADNVRHLTKSLRAVAKALGLPRVVLGLLFGKGRRPSRGYAEIRDTYHAALSKGGTAGKFAPEPQARIEDPDAWRARVMSYHEIAATALREATSSWSEVALDRYRIPHPLLGKLTVREMLLFTLYHNVHHVTNVQKRLAPP